MNRRRRRLLGDPWGGGKRPRGEGPGGDPRPDGTPAAVEAALAAVAALFPRRLFGDALPPLVLRHQLYDLVPDRTAVDRHLNRLRDEGRVRLLHLGLGPDELAVVFMEPYREKVLAAVAGTPREGLVRRFLDTAVAASAALSYDEAQMRALGFEDRDITYGAVGGSGAADGARRRQLVVGAAGGREGRPRRAARPPGAVGADPPHSAPGAAAGAGFGGVAAPPGTEPGAALPSARPSGGAAPAQVRPRVVREQLLWVSGEGHGGVHTFRVPLVIVTPGGALLACAEGRKRSPDDVGAKVIACRRSPDRGATWGPTRVATDDGWSPDGLSLGALGVAGGDVLLLFARCAHPPQACGPPTTQLLRSRDDGRSWGAPQNLSGVLGSEVFAPGPGYGIQKRLPPARGRLLFCGHGTLERDGVRLLLSDDGGHSWRWGGTLPAIPFGAPRRPHDFTPDECQHPQPELLPVPVPHGGAELGRGGLAAPQRRRLRPRPRGPRGGGRRPRHPRPRLLQQPRAREPAGEPDAALELHERHHVVGAGPARVGGAERVLLDGSPAPLRPGLLPAPLPHLRERAEPIHRERCLGDHQHRRAVTPPINPIRHSRLRVMPEGAGSVAIATQRGGSLRTPAGLPCAVPAWSAMVAWR
ncbi:uncharacterized protein LOC128849620 isoform X2 [Cuculus canorus]|uniref:uncharacterized protein LOC128849620 isoform X2 n=1 Tax=Cuculus canorus TaxID=55661 RepID=UPI0023AA8DE4|nr:uncharacterized protein LOC128849620 isoform X2 [Cuculus canorus]